MSKWCLTSLLALTVMLPVAYSSESPLSISCPCRIASVNQTALRLEIGFVQDWEVDQVQPMEFTLGLGPYKSLGGSPIVAAGGASVATPSSERQEFVVYMPKFRSNALYQGYPVLGVWTDATLDQYVAQQLFSESPVVVDNEFGVRFGSDDEPFSYFEKGFSEVSLTFDKNGAAFVSAEVVLDKVLDSHLEDYPEHTKVHFVLTDESGTNAVSYFLFDLNDEAASLPSIDLSEVDVLADENGDLASDYLQSILGNTFGTTEMTSPAVLEVVFTYGEQAKNVYGSSLEARVDELLRVSNETFLRSGVNATLSLRKLIYVGDDTGKEITSRNMNEMIERSGIFEGFDEELRRKPDIFVHLIAREAEAFETVGKATSGGFRANGVFSIERNAKNANVAWVNLEAYSDSVLVHEIGHILGLGHHRFETEARKTLGTFPWAKGHGVTGEFVTVMPYESDFENAREIEIFSNPSIECSVGLKCGVPESNLYRGANAAKALNITAWQVSGYGNGFPPYLGLDGDQEVYLTSLDDLSEPKLVAGDSEDGDLTSKISRTLVEQSETSFLATYHQTFSVLDIDGNKAELKRIIHIIPPDTDGDGISDDLDTDDDADGVLDDLDQCPLGTVGKGQSALSIDVDRDGCDDLAEDLDLGNDGFVDSLQDQQIVSLQPNDYVVDRFRKFEIKYSTEPLEQKSVGVGVSLFYDSSKVTVSVNKIPESVSDSLLGFGSDNIDFKNLDSDVRTDKYFAIAFASYSGNFPATGAWEENELVLAELLIEYLGDEEDTSIAYLITEPASGYAKRVQLLDLTLGVQTNDSDDDGIENSLDAFPLDPAEWLDTDGDGIGNNADLDDDGDGFTDEEELADGTNPLSRFSCRSGCFSFDIDENKESKALTDGLLVIRHLFGFTGDALATGAVATDAERNLASDISTLLSDADSELDIDGNGESKALTDGLLLIRYLFGFTGDALTAGAIGDGATRNTSEAVEAYISDRVPASE
jgi:hypothetical protein